MALIEDVIQLSISAFEIFPVSEISVTTIQNYLTNQEETHRKELSQCLDPMSNEYLSEMLQGAIDACYKWQRFGNYDKSNENSKDSYLCDENSSITTVSDMNSSDSNFESKVTLWAVLKRNHSKMIEGVIALLHVIMTKGSRIGANANERILGLNACKLYFNMLNVPGSTVYNLFYEEVYQLAISILKLPKQKKSKGSGNTSSSKKKKGNHTDVDPLEGCSQNSIASRRSSCVSEDGNSDKGDGNSEKGETYDEDDLFRMTSLIKEILIDLEVYLEKHNVKLQSHLVELTINTLCRLTSVEIEDFHENTFLQNIEPAKKSEQRKRALDVTVLAYKALIKTCLSSNDLIVTNNILNIFQNMLPNILMMDAVGQTQVQKYLKIIKEHSTIFVCHVVQKYKELSYYAARTLIQHLATKTTEKSDYRIKVTDSIITILKQLPPKNYSLMLQWFHKLLISAKANDRIMALEVFSHILGKSEISKEGLKECEIIFSSHSNIILNILGRCNDKAALVSIKAWGIIYNHLGLLFLTFENMTKETERNENREQQNMQTEENEVNGVVENQVVMNGIIEDDEMEIEENGNEEIPNDKDLKVAKEFKKKYFDEHTFESLCAVVVSKCRNPKVNVRKGAIAFLGKMVVTKESCLKEEHLKILSDHCDDVSLCVKKQAVGSLISIFETYRAQNIVQTYFLRGVMPRILDSEATIHDKVAEGFELAIFAPLKTNTDSTKVQVAWNLVEIVASDKNNAFPQYLTKIINRLYKNKKIEPTILTRIESHINEVNKTNFWFLASKVSCVIPVQNALFAVNYWEDLTHDFNSIPIQTMSCVLQTIRNCAESFTDHQRQSFITNLELYMTNFILPEKVIRVAFEALLKLHEKAEPQDGDLNSPIIVFSEKLFKVCVLFIFILLIIDV